MSTYAFIKEDHFALAELFDLWVADHPKLREFDRFRAQYPRELAAEKDKAEGRPFCFWRYWEPAERKALDQVEAEFSAPILEGRLEVLVTDARGNTNRVPPSDLAQESMFGIHCWWQAKTDVHHTDALAKYNGLTLCARKADARAIFPNLLSVTQPVGAAAARNKPNRLFNPADRPRVEHAIQLVDQGHGPWQAAGMVISDPDGKARDTNQRRIYEHVKKARPEVLRKPSLGKTQ